MNDISFTLNSGTSHAVATKAILLYESKGSQYRRSESSYATIHDVANVGSKARPNFQVMPGAPVSIDSLVETLGRLAEMYVLNAELLPANVLSFSPMHMMWWSPATHRRVFMNNKELGKRAAVVPHPPLLHIVVKNSWYIFAMKDDTRPTKATTLCHAPYFNVYDDGKICIGSAQIPNCLSTDLIGGWEDAFFDSAFTHVNGDIRKSAHPRGEYALWKELMDGKYASYPLEYLVPTEATVESALKVVSKSMGGRHGQA